MTKKTVTVIRFKLSETRGHGTMEIIEGAGCGEAQMALEFGESHFDGI